METASRHGLPSTEVGMELSSRALLGIDEPIAPLV
jgi:hypothetical protein